LQAPGAPTPGAFFNQTASTPANARAPFGFIDLIYSKSNRAQMSVDQLVLLDRLFFCIVRKQVFGREKQEAL
jgi:hypothetical protein